MAKNVIRLFFQWPAFNTLNAGTLDLLH